MRPAARISSDAMVNAWYSAIMAGRLRGERRFRDAAQVQGPAASHAVEEIAVARIDEDDAYDLLGMRFREQLHVRSAHGMSDEDDTGARIPATRAAPAALRRSSSDLAGSSPGRWRRSRGASRRRSARGARPRWRPRPSESSPRRDLTRRRRSRRRPCRRSRSRPGGRRRSLPWRGFCCCRPRRGRRSRGARAGWCGSRECGVREPCGASFVCEQLHKYAPPRRTT